jgi:hypothetical protein
VGNNAEETIVGNRGFVRGSYNPEMGIDYTVIKVRHNY